MNSATTVKGLKARKGMAKAGEKKSIIDAKLTAAEKVR